MDLTQIDSSNKPSASNVNTNEINDVNPEGELMNIIEACVKTIFQSIQVDGKGTLKKRR